MPTDDLPRDDHADLDAARLEADWRRALDTANGALSASSRSNVLRPADAAAAADHIREERTWLSKVGPTLHKLFPARRRSDEPPA